MLDPQYMSRERSKKQKKETKKKRKKRILFVCGNKISAKSDFQKGSDHEALRSKRRGARYETVRYVEGAQVFVFLCEAHDGVVVHVDVAAQVERCQAFAGYGAIFERSKRGGRERVIERERKAGLMFSYFSTRRTTARRCCRSVSDVRFVLGMVLSLKGQTEKELKEEKRRRGGRERVKSKGRGKQDSCFRISL
jgi:hypothetical protein